MRIALTIIATLAIALGGCATPGYRDANASYATSDGRTGATVEIDASPSLAWIFVDGEYVGVTPLDYEMTYAAGSRAVLVAAVPVDRRRVRQVKRLQVPPLPRHLHFFVDNPPANAARE